LEQGPVNYAAVAPGHPAGERTDQVGVPTYRAGAAILTKGTGSRKMWGQCTPATPALEAGALVAAAIADLVWNMSELLLLRIPPWRQQLAVCGREGTAVGTQSLEVVELLRRSKQSFRQRQSCSRLPGCSARSHGTIRRFQAHHRLAA